MLKKLMLTAALMAAGTSNAALTSGDIAFTSFNADEDGLSFVTFVDIAANTRIYFSDNEWSGTAFNTGESYNQWQSGAALISAGSVIRLSAYDSSSNLSASLGTLSRVSVASNTNWGIAASAETIYAYLGDSATAPTTFLAAITNGSFATDGSLTNTGLTEGVNAIRLNTNAPSASPDYAEYNGLRSGEIDFAAYRPMVNNVANWTVDTTNGSYAASVPNTAAFAVTPVPEADTYGMLLAGLGMIGLMINRRKSA